MTKKTPIAGHHRREATALPASRNLPHATGAWRAPRRFSEPINHETPAETFKVTEPTGPTAPPDPAKWTGEDFKHDLNRREREATQRGDLDPSDEQIVLPLDRKLHEINQITAPSKPAVKDQDDSVVVPAKTATTPTVTTDDKVTQQLMRHYSDKSSPVQHTTEQHPHDDHSATPVKDKAARHRHVKSHKTIWATILSCFAMLIIGGCVGAFLNSMFTPTPIAPKAPTHNRVDLSVERHVWRQSDLYKDAKSGEIKYGFQVRTMLTPTHLFNTPKQHVYYVCVDKQYVARAQWRAFNNGIVNNDAVLPFGHMFPKVRLYNASGKLLPLQDITGAQNVIVGDMGPVQQLIKQRFTSNAMNN